MDELARLQVRWLQILDAFANSVHPQKNKIFVIGCSTSEITGHTIGKAGSLEIAEMMCQGLLAFREKYGVFIAVQCCEHLNRALVVPRQLAEQECLTIVQAIPQRYAGGALGTVFFEKEQDAVLVEAIQADYGMDIGLTLIGMHLKPVAIPVRLPFDRLGQAIFTAAKTRPKYIGGARAVYDIK